MSMESGESSEVSKQTSSHTVTLPGQQTGQNTVNETHYNIVQRQFQNSPSPENVSTGSDHIPIHIRDATQTTQQPVSMTEKRNRALEKGDPHQIEQKDYTNVQICPRINCPEKIVICLDMSKELEKPTFKSRAGDKFVPRKLIRRAVGIFMKSKLSIDRRHQFALLLIHHEAHWAVDFTNDPDEIVSYLSGMESTYPTESCNLSSVFEMIHERVPLPKVDNPRILPPPYIVRAILVYGQSYCLPTFASKEAEKLLNLSPYFFLDAFYIHEAPSEENKCEEIFDTICDLDAKGLSYVFEVSRNPTKLYDAMAQLLAHPLQRPLQKDAYYEIEDPNEPAILSS